MSNINNDDHNEWLHAIQGVTPLNATERVETPTAPRYREPEGEILVTTHDLHGMTMSAAYEYVTEVIQEAHAYGLTQIRIITGKSGEIRQQFQGWVGTRAFRHVVRGTILEKTGGSYLVFLHQT